MHYYQNDLVKVAKRENNTKRGYLLVNPLQAKHIPVLPSKALEMFDALADKLQGIIHPKTTLIIGFAETATAIGSHLAIKLGTNYMQTTREDKDGARYIYFSEEHSHASEQRIIRNELDEKIDDITDIVFVDDEITTGKTILNAVSAIKKAYKKNKLSFHALSLVNGMDRKALSKFAIKGISVRFLVKTDNGSFEKTAASYEIDGKVIPAAHSSTKINTIPIHGAVDARIMTTGRKLEAACENLFTEILECMHNTNGSLLVIGTEECMYPAIYAAARAEKRVSLVRTHSTTRSPIAVCTDGQYPLHTRFGLQSFYDSERTTYIYDLAKYDHVVIISDADGDIQDGTGTLVAALEAVGCSNIELVRWLK